MEFVKLNYKILKELKVKGFNALRSRADVDSNDPSWVPDRIDIKFASYSYVKTEFNNFLVIENVLQNADEVELTGMVFLER
jgi:hypothetical protein